MLYPLLTPKPKYEHKSKEIRLLEQQEICAFSVYLRSAVEDAVGEVEERVFFFFFLTHAVLIFCELMQVEVLMMSSQLGTEPQVR